MDPALFRLDYEILGEAFTTIVLLAILVERGLSLLFEHRGFISKFGKKGIKEPIAFPVSFAVVRFYGSMPWRSSCDMRRPRCWGIYSPPPSWRGAARHPLSCSIRSSSP
jgi:hypothetical protein